MSLPIVPVFEGGGEVFLKRVAAFAHTLPDVFNNIEHFKLAAAYRGLKKLRFVEKLERGSSALAFYDKGKDIISVYPMAFNVGNRIDQALYTGLGLRHLHLNISNDDQHRWEQKLIVPVKAVIDRFVNHCRQEDVQSYKAVIGKFNRADDKLQVIHICNALIASNVQPKALRSIDVYTHPATSEFCKGLRPYSLIPLLSAYVGGDHLDKYESAFAAYLLHKGKFMATETSVEAQLVELFERVTHVE